MRCVLIFCVLGFSWLVSPLCSEEYRFEEYRFAGRHFLASYLDCDEEALMDSQGVLAAMDEAVFASHATILSKQEFFFDPQGLTAAYLLSESHASIHTYPEHRSCFVDLFTCGNKCMAEDFDRIMRKYLKPGRVISRTFLRSDTIEESSPSSH